VLPTVLTLLADVCCTLEKVDEAEDLVMRARDMAAADDVLTQIKWRSALGRTKAKRGLKKEAQALVREAIDLAESTEYIDWQANAWADLGEVLDSDQEGRNEALKKAAALYAAKEMTVLADRALASMG
jgi:uncharacterized protein HemY